MDTEQSVRNALMEIEQKHKDFFKENQKSIVDFITIYWGDPVYIRIKDNRLPIEISLDIGEAFEFFD